MIFFLFIYFHFECFINLEMLLLSIFFSLFFVFHYINHVIHMELLNSFVIQ